MLRAVAMTRVPSRSIGTPSTTAAIVCAANQQNAMMLSV
jgi:hypothetical protein